MVKQAGQAEKRSVSHKSQPVRLYQKATFTGFKRGQRDQHEQQALLAIEGCKDRASSKFYHGKRVAYIWKAKNSKTASNFKCRWGKVISSHGNNGMVRAKFAKNLTPRSFGATLRVMLYPNKSI
mmetsp:Transcript_18488/g.25550  ORF Transcript_18488/g.25550 Transcript_18488/m.25550 type:complete len:124 (+) Transcript_18488:66-437(+)|eukprot:CAMPEP_0176360014 /NCGR_PEP_ID=MMETSP0126-20121128/16819_1 /TAXON_ID=141414 ORGANISM="Strombidinopsis acuminatum, Strain SPMC142" /NCGR_SAMPLE_ID=MMETSP0126 /ASSEMBLY_ACC=CAM_ASM_000229 /LENGTH=123 /DNA_ID=CAMNT_0017715137 /DNA_START=43 /DNA_END=414 /DNA_ORIENTATION=-